MKSVFQNEKVCFVCGTTHNIEEHHIIYGTSNRKISERYGLKVYLCHHHHTGNEGVKGNRGVHFNKDLDIYLKIMAQEYYEAHYGDRNAFIRDFGRSYI